MISKWSQSVVLLYYLFVLGSAVHSGLYLDNGRDQTVVHHSLSNRDRQYFEVEFLDLLGLAHRPRLVRSSPVRSSGHKYLLELYKSQLDAPARAVRSQFDVSETDLGAIETSDAIISLKNLYHFDSNVTDTGDAHKLWFDIQTIPQTLDGIVKAELRVFQRSSSNLPDDKTYTVTVNIIQADAKGEEQLELVQAVNTTAGFEGWHSFNMTGPLASWMSSGNNRGLYLRAYDTKSPGVHVDLNELGIARGAPQPSDEDEDEPFMIVFVHGETHRSTRVKRLARPRKKKTENSETPNINPLTDGSVGHSWSLSPRSCQIQSLFVNFSDLEWQDWIIAPVGYSAFYCSGECNFPLNAHMNATNHAIVQTLVNLINPLKVPRPCCAPTKLTPISVLYFVDDNNVILKKYKNMVVKSCGCH